MEILIVWLFFAALVGAAAGSKGRSGLGWFFLAVLISPIIAGLLILVMPRVAKAVAAPPVIGVADELTKLAALRDSGAITPAEFDRQRAALLPAETPQKPGPVGWQG